MLSPREYFYRAVAGMDELYLEMLVAYGAGHPVTEYVREVRDICRLRLEEFWYIA